MFTRILLFFPALVFYVFNQLKYIYQPIIYQIIHIYMIKVGMILFITWITILYPSIRQKQL